MDRAQLLEEIKGLAAETLEVDTDDVTEASRFSDDLEADSLDLVELVMAMEEKFDIKIDESELEDIETVGQVIDIVEVKIKS
ncbi:MAG: acyl carrier protein [Acidimicrobiia bacterium]|nr:acyl carrier protein [Acidimicrobiia bacterium]